MTTVRDVLVDAERRLQSAGIPSPASDAAQIVSHVLERPRSALFLHDGIASEQRVRIERLVVRRSSRVPLQHLLGSAPFRHLELQVGPGVFIPRPETELVAEVAIRFLRETRSGADKRVVDLCAGSGALGLSIASEVPSVHVHCLELSEDAFAWLQRNVDETAPRVQAVGSRVTPHLADARHAAVAGASLANLAGQVDVVVSNPPYIPDVMVPREPEVREHEPKVALYGGQDGLDVVRGIMETAAILLRSGGLLVIEHADVQGDAAGDRGVPGVLAHMVSDVDSATVVDVPVGIHVWQGVTDRFDLNGLPRFTTATKWAGS